MLKLRSVDPPQKLDVVGAVSVFIIKVNVAFTEGNLEPLSLRIEYPRSN
jgi:hypothetical protein